MLRTALAARVAHSSPSCKALASAQIGADAELVYRAARLLEIGVVAVFVYVDDEAREARALPVVPRLTHRGE